MTFRRATTGHAVYFCRDLRRQEGAGGPCRFHNVDALPPMALSQQSTYVPNTGFGRERLRCRGAMAEVDPDQILGILTAHRATLASGGARLVQARHWRP